MATLQPPSAKRSWPTTILWLLFYAILIAHLSGPMRNLVRAALAVPDAEGPGVDPPFYFAREDFVDGICAGIAELLILVLVAVTRRRFRDESWTILFVGSLFFVPKYVESCIIYWRCPGVMGAGHGQCRWATFREFLHDPLREFGFYGTLLLLAAFFSTVFKRKPRDRSP